ncbi:MAG: hypothetical protein ACI9CF_001436, partial [Candidatus Omnitrophota bacterium]
MKKMTITFTLILHAICFLGPLDAHASSKGVLAKSSISRIESVDAVAMAAQELRQKKLDYGI